MKVTAVTYTLASEKMTIYTAYHCTVRGKKKQYIDLNSPTTKAVGQVKKEGWNLKADHMAMARYFETPEYPAFNWGRS